LRGTISRKPPGGKPRIPGRVTPAHPKDGLARPDALGERRTMTAAVLAATDHRPWPLPRRPWLTRSRPRVTHYSACQDVVVWPLERVA
jgi:hypothetical protein